MKNTFTVLVLIASVSFTFADNANWSSDDDTLPERLPKKLQGKSDDEIQKAVFQAYENQLKVISEYNGNLVDSESPYGYFKDEMPIPNTKTSNPQSDLIFLNNGIRGFIGHNKNNIIIKWVPDQVVTEIAWKELSVRGRYTFLNSTYFDQGKYQILLKDLTYLASTTLSENTGGYPSMFPKSSISFKNILMTFTGGLPQLSKISDSSNVKHFVEDIIFQNVADRIVKDTHKNITSAIRQTISKYVIFQNDTVPNFPSLNGKLPTGNLGYSFSNTIISGFSNTELKLKKVTSKIATSTLTADLRLTIHSLNGKFDFKLEETKPTIGKGTFTVGRIDISVSFNMLKTNECKSEVTINQQNMKFDSKLTADNEKALIKAFFDHVTAQLNTKICKTFGQAIKPSK